VKRYKGIVGKFIGGKLYVHRTYAPLVVGADILSTAVGILREKHPAFEYNVVVWHPVRGQLRFVMSPDFDTASEPVVGDCVTVDLLNKTASKVRSYPHIWHHKYLWVQDGYPGFDVEESRRWAETWKLVLKEPPASANRKVWEEQLQRHGLERPEDKTNVLTEKHYRDIK